MKRIVILLLLFIAAIAIAPLLVDEKGYILIKMGDSARETTVTAAVAMVLALFFVLIFTLSIIKGSIGISTRAWHKIAFASQRRAAKDFNNGISAYVLKDYQKAEYLMAKCAEPSQMPALCYLVAASAADAQKLKANTEHYLAALEQLETKANKADLSIIIVKVQLLMNLENFKSAREILDTYHKHLGHDVRLLSLEIDLSLIEKRYSNAIELLNTARKSKEVSESSIEAWESAAFSGQFEQLAKEKDKDALINFWNSLARKIKQRDNVVVSYCQVLAKHNISATLAEILLPVIKKHNNPKMLMVVRELIIADNGSMLTEVQKQLHKSPHSYQWLSLMAHLANNAKQYDIAEKAFNSLVNSAHEKMDKLDYQTFAILLQDKGDFKRANEMLLKLI